MVAGEIWCISGQNITIQRTYCFGYRQLEDRNILKLGQYLPLIYETIFCEYIIKLWEGFLQKRRERVH